MKRRLVSLVTHTLINIKYFSVLITFAFLHYLISFSFDVLQFVLNCFLLQEQAAHLDMSKQMT